MRLADALGLVGDEHKEFIASAAGAEKRSATRTAAIMVVHELGHAMMGSLLKAGITTTGIRSIKRPEPSDTVGSNHDLVVEFMDGQVFYFDLLPWIDNQHNLPE